MEKVGGIQMKQMVLIVSYNGDNNSKEINKINKDEILNELPIES